jgi:WD40 repeat protein
MHAAACSANGRLLATASEDKNVVVWDVASGQQLACCRGHDEPVYALAFAYDDRTLASAGLDRTVRLWDAATGEAQTVLRRHAHCLSALAFSPEQRTLASADWDGLVLAWDLVTGTARALGTTSGATASPGRPFEGVTAVSFAPAGQTLAVARDRSVQLWDVETGRLVARLEGHTGRVRCLAFSSDGAILASGGHDRTVRLWDITRYRASRPGPQMPPDRRASEGQLEFPMRVVGHRSVTRSAN